ncbi:MAG: hypothetical protein V3V19_11160 [Cocleimonas sp.]
MDKIKKSQLISFRINEEEQKNLDIILESKKFKNRSNAIKESIKLMSKSISQELAGET